MAAGHDAREQFRTRRSLGGRCVRMTAKSRADQGRFGGQLLTEVGNTLRNSASDVRTAEGELGELR
jgi:hypothetical protein